MKAAIIGYGKMGHEIERILIERGHTVSLIIDEANAADLNEQNLKDIDVAIEFTTPSTAYNNIRQCIECGTPVVSGTTGWTERLEELKALCEQKGSAIFYASNYSLGVNMMFRLNRRLAELMNHHPQYEVAIEEVHHIHKKDAPSGTAITLAEGILENLDRKANWVMGDLTNPDGSVTEGAAPKDNELKIDAIRRDEVPGIHTVTYNSPADTITITHDAHNRSGFALGAVLAAEYVKENSGMLGMSNLFDF
jgi:4-hydroxy-tetrahydrodipicolinate reductase